MSEEVKNKIVWYTKNWYKSTGDVLEDLKIILDGVLFTEDWRYSDAVSILFNDFEDLFKKNMRDIIDRSTFSNRYVWEKDKNPQEEMLKTLLSVISFQKVEIYKDFLDEKYQKMYNLREMK